jgi:hypothetical protein
MKNIIVSLTTALVLALAEAMTGGHAQAAAISPEGLRPAADALAAVNKVQFIYRGRRFCWYWDGWRGPGWYWCGYEWRRGFGWGGPVGWRGWRRPSGGRPSANRPGGGRPSANRPGGGRRPSANRPGGGRPSANRPSGGGRGGRGGRGGGGGGRGGGSSGRSG